MNERGESTVEAGRVMLQPLLVDTKEAARLLKVGRTTIYELMNAGAIKPVRIGRCVRIAVTELERFVAEGCPTAVSTPPPPPSKPPAKRRTPRRSPSRGSAPRLFDPAT